MSTFFSRIAIVCTFVMATGIALAQPATINVHGAVATPGGDPLSGTRAYSVQFYDAPTGGNAIGSEFTGLVNVSPSGVFNLPLIPPAGIFIAAEVWYELGIDTDEPADNNASDDVFLGRVQLQSVPFALLAAEASHVDVENVGDGSISQAELSALDGVTSSIQSQIDTLDSGSGDNAADILALQAEQLTQDTAIAGKADAADVYTKTEVDTSQGAQDTMIAAKADAADVYTKTEVDTSQGAQDTAIAAKADAADVYTKTEVDASQGAQDTAIAAKADAASVYTKTEVDTAQGVQDTAIAAKADAADVYTKTEVDTTQGVQDTAIAAKADAADVYTKTEVDTSQGAQDTAIAAKADAADVYTKTEVDTSQGAQDTAIAAKADAASVYTKTEVDTNFVAVAGDTMTGSLDISDTTASTSDTTGALTVAGGAGVAGDLNIGGEASADALTIASAGAPPGTTTDKLYNVGGALFFAGAEISGDGPLGTSIESSEITNDTIVDADINTAASISASKLSSSVVVSGEGNAQLTNDAGYLTSVNSAAISNDTIVDADINSAAAISASKLSSTVVVSGEGNAQLTNDAGYLTAESDTLSAVTGRGASTSTQITLNAGVKTDTVSEVTSANGVSVDGVKMKDNFVELTSISAPSPTTNRLYNEGGTLKFNGTSLGGGGGTKYTVVSWEIIAFNSTVAGDRDLVRFKAPFAGTIVNFQSFMRLDLSSAGTADLRINGTSVIGGDKSISTFFQDETLIDNTSLLSGATFNAGDVIAFHGNCTTGQLAQPQVTLTLSY